ncbi:MAG TPA: hypothetical protein VFP77_05290 [Gemmatimonadaceae bacterium]|jgi:hypothetical protein|nr:hypothetical protein [Gemmatimonadaceae bacterium]
MSALAVLIAATLTSAAAAQQDSNATLSFNSQTWVPSGYAYGIEAIDNEERGSGLRLTADIGAGHKTIWYSCPGTPEGALTFDFEAGRKYELVCNAGVEAEIRSVDC